LRHILSKKSPYRWQNCPSRGGPWILWNGKVRKGCGENHRQKKEKEKKARWVRSKEDSCLQEKRPPKTVRERGLKPRSKKKLGVRIKTEEKKDIGEGI